MNSEGELIGFKEFNPLEGFTYFPDGKVPLEVGRSVDKGPEIDFVRYGDKKGIERGVFYRTKDGNAINFSYYNEVKGIFAPTWGQFSASAGEIVFEAGIEVGQSSEDLLTFVYYDLSSGELFFTNNEDWIRVGGYFIEGYDDKNYGYSQGSGWQRFGPELKIKIKKNEDSSLTVSLALELEKEKLVVHNATLLNALLELYKFKTLQELINYALESNDNTLLDAIYQAALVSSTNFFVVFTTRLPNESSIKQIIDPEIDLLRSRTLALEYTPQLRLATSEEEEIFKSLQ